MKDSIMLIIWILVLLLMIVLLCLYEDTERDGLLKDSIPHLSIKTQEYLESIVWG